MSVDASIFRKYKQAAQRGQKSLRLYLLSPHRSVEQVLDEVSPFIDPEAALKLLQEHAQKRFGEEWRVQGGNEHVLSGTPEILGFTGNTCIGILCIDY